MRKFITSCFIIGILLICGFTFQTADPDTIPWSEKRKLVWNDFKGPQDPNSDFIAFTSYHINYRIDYKADTAYFRVNCFFKKSESWVKSGGKTVKILAHEQLHFDIGELFTRKVRKRLANHTYGGMKLVKNEAQQIFQGLLDSCSAAQDKYDEETEHSIATAKQAEWEKKIPEELKKYKAYSTPDFKVCVKKK